MSATPTRPRGLYFEEFETGMRITTPGRTITESDIVSFAGLTGDFNLDPYRRRLQRQLAIWAAGGARITGAIHRLGVGDAHRRAGRHGDGFPRDQRMEVRQAGLHRRYDPRR